MRNELVFPVGLLVGTYHDHGDPGGHHHEVRRGGRVQELTDADLAAWLSAHGPPGDAAEDTPWTGAAVLRHLTTSGVPGAAPLVDALLDRSLLAEVAPGSAAAVAFARAHRVVPILSGLGNSAEEPWLYSIGLIGQERIQVSRLIFELWAWSHLDDNLWTACETLAALDRGGDDAGPQGPDALLAGFLTALHGLLSVQAAYIDTVEQAT